MDNSRRMVNHVARRPRKAGPRSITMSGQVIKGKGTAVVRAEICKGCCFCIDFCPSHALEFSTEFNAKGYHFPLLVREEDCSGCDLCGMICPDFAIFGIRWRDLDGRQAGVRELQSV